MTICFNCSKTCNVDDSNSCSKCKSCIHHKCVFNAKMLPSAWTNNNTPPQYAWAIFNFLISYYIVITV